MPAHILKVLKIVNYLKEKKKSNSIFICIKKEYRTILNKKSVL